MQDKYTGIEVFSVENIPLYSESCKQGCVVAFDTETTGLHNHDDIVQLAWVVMENGLTTRADYTYVRNLSVPIDGTEAQQANGLSDAYLALEGREPKEVYSRFFWMLKTYAENHGRVVLVAHNLAFDLRMLQNNMMRYGREGETLLDLNQEGLVIGCDTRDFAKSLGLPARILPNHKLETCIQAFALDATNSHDALDDTKACMELFKFLAKED